MYTQVVCTRCGKHFSTSEGATLCRACANRRDNGQRLAARRAEQRAEDRLCAEMGVTQDRLEQERSDQAVAESLGMYCVAHCPNDSMFTDVWVFHDLEGALEVLDGYRQKEPWVGRRFGCDHTYKADDKLVADIVANVLAQTGEYQVAYGTLRVVTPGEMFRV